MKSKLRKSLVAPPGHQVLVADSSQIEARMNAWFCGQLDVVDAFAAKKDLYSMAGSEIFGYPVNKVDHPIERYIGKTSVLGLGFRCGANKFYNMVVRSARMYMKPEEYNKLMQVWTTDLAEKAVATYRAKNAKIVQMWSKLDAAIRGPWYGQEAPAQIGPVEIGNDEHGHGYVKLPNGMFLRYAKPEWDNEQQAYFYTFGRERHHIHGGPLLENIVQALARIVTMNAALRLWDRGYHFKLQSHDELAFIVPDDQCARDEKGRPCGIAISTVLEELRRPPSWARTLPLDAEANFGRSYGDAK